MHYSYPVLFLDIDGVINLAGWRREALAELNRIVIAADARVVITSDWRHSWTQNELQTELRCAGYLFSIHDYTPVVVNQDSLLPVRAQEITMWRTNHRHLGPYCILDDIDFFKLTPHAAQFIQVAVLNKQDADRALQLLQPDA